MASVPLVGRDRELTRLREFISGIQRLGCALLLTGDPGIGKSALTAATTAFARDASFLVLRGSGVESEAQLPFAVLHQLLHPVMDQIDALPDRQRGVLLGALGHIGGDSPDQYLVALATLDLLAQAAEPAPVLVVVDDAHWVDPSTARVLAFVARRLEAEPIGMLVVLRSNVESPLLEAGLDELEVVPLETAAAKQLLNIRDPFMVLADRDRVLSESAGNPLALVELPTTGAELDTGILSSRLTRAFGARLRGLSTETQIVLLIAALNDGDRVSEILAAAARAQEMSVGPNAVDPAVERQIVTVEDDRLTFSHPLMRSAVVKVASPTERRRAHAALSWVMREVPERSVWHRAASMLQADEQVAEDLELVANDAERRGNPGVSQRAWERAAQLSESSTRLRRLLQAAELALELGQLPRAETLSAQAADLVATPAEKARLVLIRDAVDPGSPRDLHRILALVDSARAVARADEPELALRLLYSAALRGWWADANESTRLQVISATRELELDHDPRALAVLGQADPIRWGKPVVEAVAALRPERLDAASASLMGTAFLVGGADRNLSVLQNALAEGLRLQGRVRELPALLAQQVWTSINLADWAAADPAADEGMRLAHETGQPNWFAASQIGAGMIAALRGDHERANQLVAEAEAAALPFGVSALLTGIQLTRGVSAIGRGRFDEAFAALLREFTETDPAFHEFQNRWAFGDLAEAAFHAGRVEEVRALGRRQGEAVATPWHAVAAQYAAPFLVEDESAAGALFEAALAGEVSRWPIYRVRATIEYGAWLRRHRRPVEARDKLREARDAADALGLVPWAERARQELRAAGEQSGVRQPGAWESLSPQELQVARLAAGGMSNREIGQRLFLSHRTVGSHLYRLFPKLGVSNRAQLAAVVVLEGP